MSNAIEAQERQVGGEQPPYMAETAEVGKRIRRPVIEPHGSRYRDHNVHPVKAETKALV